MYDERPYGEILRDERERNGYDLNTMSRRLHIRPDILAAIEQSDFDRMPARGYSKNMVRAYARALHLDERQISEIFLDQAHQHDVGESRRSSSSIGFSERPSRNRGYSRDQGSSTYSSRRDRNGRYSDSRSLNLDDASSRSRRRSTYSREDSRSRSTYGRDLPASETARSRSLERERSGNRGGGFSAGALFQSLANRGGRQETKVGRSFDTIGSNPPYARNNVGGRAANTLAGINAPLLLMIVAALIVLIIVVVVVTNGSQQAVQDVPNIPIAGLTDTSGTDSSSSSSDDVIMPNNQPLPVSAEVVLDVAEGQDSWIEVYENGSSSPSIAKVVSGPFSQVFDVDKTIKIRTANPSAVTVTVDDKKVKFTDEGDGNYSYTFDFNTWLAQWKKDNGVDEPSSKSKKSSSSRRSSST